MDGVSRVIAYHVDNLGVYRFDDDTALRCDIFQHFSESLRFNGLSLKLAARIIEIEDNFALIQFSDEQLYPVLRRTL